MIETAVIYARISSVKQEDGFSIDAQLKFLNDYSLKKGYVLVEQFITTESAKLKGRKTFNEMIDMVKKKKIKHILVEKTDRLLRNMGDYVAIEDLVNKKGISLHLVKEGTILNENSGSNEKFIFGIKSLLAKQFIDNLREETSKGMKESLAQGNYTFRAPLGYKYTPNNKQIEVDEPLSSNIKTIFKEYLKGESVKFLSSEYGIGRNTVHKMLKNPFYIGKMRAFGKIFDGNHEPLIDVDTFYD
ncbi:MAG: recombinase family protein, partial [Candidatus Margulisbacteria bacterium]|nr:recombinase family protein [Candidatus Margulisiibacteriota bacterium]